MDDKTKDALTVAGTTGAGAAIGCAIVLIVGGMGLAVLGTAMGLPIVAICTGLGLIIGGVYVLGRRMGQKGK